MTLPEGWPEGSNAPKIVVRLRKALYGLKQAPQLWHNNINACLRSLGFTQSAADPNLYLRSEGILILLYVDDISMSYLEAATKAAIEVKAKLSEKYKITNLGPASLYFGIKIYRDDTGISLGQNTHIATILRRFGMKHTHGASTPMDPNVKLDLAKDWGEKELEQEDITDNRAVMGSLMYAALATRPDISSAVAALSRDNSRPFTSHMTAAKRVLQYPKSTADFRLHFNGDGIGIGISIGIGIGIDNSLVRYSDSDWANDSVDRKSQGGHVFLANNGGAVSWQSRKQGLVTMSTLKAEFIACSGASRDAKSLLQLQKDIHGKDLPPLPMDCDNQGALTLITTGIIKARTKHIDVCYHKS